MSYEVAKCETDFIAIYFIDAKGHLDAKCQGLFQKPREARTLQRKDHQNSIHTKQYKVFSPQSGSQIKKKKASCFEKA